jgi:hypothetical protein
MVPVSTSVGAILEADRTHTSRETADERPVDDMQDADRGAPNARGEREALMTEFSITHKGRHYEYDRYRYTATTTWRTRSTMRD